jgi:hypothetical protein
MGRSHGRGEVVVAVEVEVALLIRSGMKFGRDKSSEIS